MEASKVFAEITEFEKERGPNQITGHSNYNIW